MCLQVLSWDSGFAFGALWNVCQSPSARLRASFVLWGRAGCSEECCWQLWAMDAAYDVICKRGRALLSAGAVRRLVSVSQAKWWMILQEQGLQGWTCLQMYICFRFRRHQHHAIQRYLHTMCWWGLWILLLSSYFTCIKMLTGSFDVFWMRWFNHWPVSGHDDQKFAFKH